MQSRERCPTSPPTKDVSCCILNFWGGGQGEHTVVTLLALGAITAHVAETTTRVACLTTAHAAAITATTVTSSVATSRRAIARNVADFATLVAFLASRTVAHAATTTTACLRAVTGDVTGLAALVTGLFSLGCLTFSRDVTLPATIVAGGVAFGGAVLGLMRGVATYKM